MAVVNWKSYKQQLPATIFREDWISEYNDNINTLTTDVIEKLDILTKLTSVRKGIRDFNAVLPDNKLLIRGDGLLPKLMASDVDNRLFIKNKDGKINFIASLWSIAKRVNENYDDVIKLVNESFSEKVDKNVLDYYQLNILRMLESINFFNSFTNRVNSIVTKELYILTNIDKGKSTISNDEVLSISKNPVWNADEVFVNDINTIHYFCAAVNVITKRIVDYKKQIAQLDGHMYTDGDWEGPIIPSVKNKVDPFNICGFIVTWNPIYYGGLWWNQWRNSINQRNKVELTRIKLMALYAQEELNQTNDAERIKQLNKELSVHNNTINKLDAAIRGYEEG